MSGPKTYNYSLTAAQKAILREQARIRRLTKETKKAIEERKQSVSNSVAAIDKLIESIKAIDKEIGVTGDVSVYKDIRNRAMASVNNALYTTDTMSLNKLQNISGNLVKSETELLQCKKDLVNLVEEAEKKFENKIEAAILESFSSPLYENNIENMEENKPQIDFSVKIRSVLDLIDTFNLTEELSKKKNDVKAKFSSISDPTFIKNFYAMTIVPFIKECKEYDSLYSENYPIFCDLMTKYETLANEMKITPKQFVFSVQALDEIKDEITALETLLEKNIEQEYISKCVDEAMLEMGYKFIGEREGKRKGGRKFKNELYLFDEGTAVNVTFADNGQITMELGGIDHMDRIPTNTESKKLVEDMQTFCEDYSEIATYLRKKGIEMTKISHLPSESQYAQIINVSDYSLTETVSDYSDMEGKSKVTAQKSIHKVFNEE